MIVLKFVLIGILVYFILNILFVSIDYIASAIQGEKYTAKLTIKSIIIAVSFALLSVLNFN